MKRRCASLSGLEWLTYWLGFLSLRSKTCTLRVTKVDVYGNPAVGMAWEPAHEGKTLCASILHGFGVLTTKWQIL